MGVPIIIIAVTFIGAGMLAAQWLGAANKPDILASGVAELLGDAGPGGTAMLIVPPNEPLTDGVVTLRVPSTEAGDVDTAISYSEEEGGLDGVWMPVIPRQPPQRWVEDWLEAWAGRPSHNGPTLVVTIPEEPRFVGIVGFGERDAGGVEIVYGIAPRWRGRGLASRAVRLGALWLLDQPGVCQVEARVDQGMHESQHVAVNAGFRQAGTVIQYVPGTGETFEDLRFVLKRTADGHDPIAVPSQPA